MLRAGRSWVASATVTGRRPLAAAAKGAKPEAKQGKDSKEAAKPKASDAKAKAVPVEGGDPKAGEAGEGRVKKDKRLDESW